MATYYVNASTGNDSNTTTQALSPSTPWLTINKAVQNVVGGDIVNIAAGTYQENSGSGYLNWNKFPSSLVTFQSLSGVASDVVIQSASGTTTEMLISGFNVLFQNLTFSNRSNTVPNVIRINSGFNVTFKGCRIIVTSSSSLTNQGILAPIPASTSLTSLTIDGCTITQSGADNCDGIYLNTSDVTGVIDTIAVKNSSINVIRRPLRLEGCTNVLVDFNTLVSTVSASGGTCCSLGIDNAASSAGVFPASGTITRNILYTAGGHACLVGAGVTSATVAGNVIIGGNTVSAGQGLVIKEGSNIVATDNLIFGGYNSGIYVKGAQSPTILRNVCINLFSTSSALRIDKNLTDVGGANFSNVTCRYNYCVSTIGPMFAYGVNANETGNNSVVDYNVYDVRGSGTWGSIRGTTVSSLASVKAAWNGYGTPGNDTHSLASASTINYRSSSTTGTTPLSTSPFIYRVIVDRFGNVWNGTAFVSLVAANWYQYCDYLIEATPGSYLYSTPVPLNLPAGDYKVTLFTQSGAGPALSDTKIETQNLAWDGTQTIQIGVLYTLTGGVKSKTDTLPASPAATGDQMTLTSMTVGSIRAEMDTNSSKLAFISSSLMQSDLLAIEGTVDDTAPSLLSFIVSPTNNGTWSAGTSYQGSLFCWTSGILAPKKATIRAWTYLSPSTARVTFATAWDSIPANGSSFTII